MNVKAANDTRYNSSMNGLLTQLRQDHRDALLAGASLLVLIVLLALPPHGLLDKADRAAFAVCHRIPVRSFAIDGRSLPLCARCSGMYLGALAGLVVLALLGRGRAAGFPTRPYLVVFGGFITLWAVDGLNSYLTLFPGLPHLYEPTNHLRLLTGTLQGLALAAIGLPLVNRAFRGGTVPPSVATPADLLWLLATGAAVAWLVSRDAPALLYPLALVSGLSVVGAVTLLNALFLLTLANSRVRSFLPRGPVVRLLLSAALALTELAAIGVFRSQLEALVGWPF